MPRPFEITIDNIFGGISSTEFFGSSGQYLSAIAVDPDMPKNDSSLRISGIIRPTAMAKFSASSITGTPLWMITNPKDANCYVYTAAGKVHSVASGLTMNSDLTDPTSGAGNGAEYYDNYIYLATPTNISRYGPLNGSAAMNQAYWGTTLGKTALVNTTYPTINGVVMPNHPMYRMEAADKLFIADVTTANRGAIHFIRTSKASVEGDTDNGSTHGSLLLPTGYFPSAICSLDNRLVVGAFEGTGVVTNQQRAKIFFWDTTSDTYQNIVGIEFPDQFITAIKNVNGVLYVFSGNAAGGFRVSRYAGGYSFDEVAYHEEGFSPFQGNVDSSMGRVIYGGTVTDPETAPVVWAIGSKNQKLGSGRHCILKGSESAGAITALKFYEQANNAILRPILGWKNSSTYGLDKISTTYGTWVWRSPVYRLGQKVSINKVIVPLAQAVAANMTIVPKLYKDSASDSLALTTINSTNYPNSERRVVLYPTFEAQSDFFLELRGTGTALLAPMLPIKISGDYLDS